MEIDMEIYLTTLLLVFLVIFTVTAHRYKVNQQKNKQKQGLQNISLIKELIRLTQIHRGLSSAWLNGDNTKKTQLTDIVKQVNNLIYRFETEAKLTGINRWESFTDHWLRLSKKNTNTNSKDSFNQHTQLIANLLYLLEDEAERTDLSASHLSKLPNIGYVWRELLVTTENIGQSRAIGTGVATTKHCSSVDKIRLSFLQKHIQKTTNETLVKLSALDNVTMKQDSLIKLAKSKVEIFSTTMEEELIEAKAITIDQDEYFSLATQGMKALEDIFDLQLNQVEQIV